MNQVASLEKTLNRACKAAISLHCTGILLLAFLLGLEPVGYKKMGLILSIAVFATSILISKSYFYAEKQLKQHKAASSKTPVRKFNERFLLFFLPYTLWCSCIGVFW